MEEIPPDSEVDCRKPRGGEQQDSRERPASWQKPAYRKLMTSSTHCIVLKDRVLRDERLQRTLKTAKGKTKREDRAARGEPPRGGRN